MQTQRTCAVETISLPEEPELKHWEGATREGIGWNVYEGDVNAALEVLSERGSPRFDCVVTSPPYYWQRDYHVQGQIGQEPTIHGYVKAIVDSMDWVREVMRKDGVLFLNLGDTYYSAKGEPKGKDPKNAARRFGLRAVDRRGLGVSRKTAIGLPWRVAIAMIDSGWVLRSPIVWRREACLPESASKDRPWRTYEMLFMFTKSPIYHFSREDLEGEEDVWTISERPTKAIGVHSAAFPDKLVERCINIGCREGGTVLDPFAGSGTVLRVALQSGRSAVGIDLNPSYCRHMVSQFKKM